MLRLIGFVASCLLTLLSAALFPSIKVLPFAPFLVLLLRRTPLLSLLWWAIAAGFITDLFSTQYRLGLSSFCYLAACIILFRFRKHLYEDKSLPFAFMTYVISLVVSLLFSFASLYKGAVVFPNILSFIRELFLSPITDVAIGFAFFFIPLRLYREMKQNRLKKRLEEEDE